MATIKITGDDFSEGDGTTSAQYQTTVNGTAENDVITVTVPKPASYNDEDYDEYSGAADYLVYIDAGDGNDKITLTSKSQKYRIIGWAVNALSGEITPGKGNDTIITDRRPSIYYTDGDGKDTVILKKISGGTNFYGANLGITGTIDSYKFKGATYTFNIGTGSITLKNVNSSDWVRVYSDNEKSLYLKGKKFNAIETGKVSITGTADDDFINVYEETNTVNAGLGDDYINLSGYSYNNVIQYTNGDGKDTILLGYPDEDEDDYDKQNILIYGNTYTRKTSGKDVIIKVGSGSMTLKNGKYWNLNILTIDDNGNAIPAGLSYSEDYTAATLNNNFSGNFKASDYNSAISSISAAKRTKAISITGNSADNSIIGGSKNDTLYGGDGADTLTGGKGADVFIYSGGDDVITDYTPKQKDQIKLSGTGFSTYSVSGNDVIFENSKGSLTIKNGKNQSITINGSAQIYTDPTEKLFAKSDKTLNYEAEEDIITINASKKSTKINITGNANDNIIKGTAKADTIDGGAGNDSITGGKGKDIFIFSGGNDTITDYTAGQDKIKFSEDITSAALDGNDMIFTTAGGTLRIVNAVKKKKPQKITVIDKNDVETSQIYDTASISVANSDGETIDATTAFNSKLDTINASKRSKPVVIIANTNDSTVKGGSKADTLIGGSGADYLSGGNGNDSISGGASFDTLVGGKGNDYLSGGAGADVFVYTSGDGNDIIADFTSADKIKLGSKKTTVNESKSSVSGSDYVLTIGKNTITLKDAASIPITVVDFSGNSKTYNNEAAFTEIFTDDNLDASELDSILDNGSNVISGDYLSDSDFSTFTKDNPLKLAANSSAKK